MRQDPQRAAAEAIQLRIRLEALESRFQDEINALRKRIAELESPAPTPALTPEPPPAAQPPPLPEEALHPSPEPTPLTDPTPPSKPIPVARLQPEWKIATPQPVTQADPDGGFEMRFGRIWLVRIGIGLLLTGLVLLGNYAYKNWIRDLSAGVRLTALYLCAGLLFETGRRLANRPNLSRFGEVVIAGGLSFFYYCTFAAHHVERLRVIESPPLGAILLGLAAAGMAAVSWIRQAKGTAILGILLASYATMLQPLGWLSCVSNLVLATAGCFFLTRPGWSGPGWASLLTTYASFLGWQLLGASGSRTTGSPDTALWFLPATWALFALPCLMGKFRDSMPDRAKAWFTGSNNTLAFLLFSGLWLARHDSEKYWIVAAIIGVIWISCGAWCRRKSDIAGSVFMVQGLACVSLAIILKLDGYHLALALAGESLALALTFARFRGRSELAFSIGAALIATLRMLGHTVHDPAYDLSIPIWSAGLGGLLLLVTSAVLLWASETSDEERKPFARAGSTIIFSSALAAILVGWCLRLEKPWPMPTAMAISLAFAATSLLADRSRRWIELLFGSIVSLIVTLSVMALQSAPWAFATTALIAIAALCIWQHRAIPEKDLPSPNHDLANFPDFPIWLHSSAITAATFGAIHFLDIPPTAKALYLGLSGLLLVAAGLLLRLPTLVPTASLLGVASLVLLGNVDPLPAAPLFTLTAIQLATFAIAILPRFRPLLPAPLLLSTAAITRITAFFSWCAAWIARSPDHWGDWIALTSLALIIISHRLTRRLIAETTPLLGLAIAWGLVTSASQPWSIQDTPASWRGWAVILTLLYLALTSRNRSSFSDDRPTQNRSVALIGAIACAGIALWTTQLIVWHHGWKPTAVVWTLLGFAAVSTGLWQRLQIFRLSGFALLALAILKVFAFDVWDFNAFMRVVSFIVLGLALMLLGLFYHRFAPLLKQWLDSDEKYEAPAQPDQNP